MMKIAFDLDGTLDRRNIADLADSLIHDRMNRFEVHIISAVFDESGDWQDESAKKEKIRRVLGFSSYDVIPENLKVHFLHAIPDISPIDERLRDLGLRKAALCEKLGISIIFDDSPTFCEIMPRMFGDLTVLQVR